MSRSATDLTLEKALIWRVVHRDNLPWMLDQGVHCANSSMQDPDYVQIGLADLIEERRERVVPLAPAGQLSDYVPFYFTPFSPMVYRIVTGRGVLQSSRAELCFLVTSCAVHQLVPDPAFNWFIANFGFNCFTQRMLLWAALYSQVLEGFQRS